MITHAVLSGEASQHPFKDPMGRKLRSDSIQPSTTRQGSNAERQLAEIFVDGSPSEDQKSPIMLAPRCFYHSLTYSLTRSLVLALVMLMPISDQTVRVVFQCGECYSQESNSKLLDVQLSKNILIDMLLPEMNIQSGKTSIRIFS